MSQSSSTVTRDHAACIVVDIQYDFLPGGALAVAQGDHIIDPVARLMRSELFSVIVATQDWHPRDHVSFASRHNGKEAFDTIELYGHDQTLWPDHCVQNTEGAELHPDLPWDRVNAFIRKGVQPDVDSYSGFRNNWAPDGSRPKTGLAGYLRERGIRDVYICGLARDVCVRWTAEDAVDEGFTTTLLWDATRSVTPAEDSTLQTALEHKGISLIGATELRT